MGVIEAKAPVRTVEAEINYLSGGSFINRRYVAPGIEHNTGTYEPHRVLIGDARPSRGDFTLHGNGFALVDHKSRVGDFFDREHVDSIYPGEVLEAVKAITGADRVAPMGWMARTSGDLAKHLKPQTGGYKHQGGVQPPAGEAHVDMLPDRAERHARMLHDKHFPEKTGYSRFIATSFWRTFSEPPQDWPLAVCDGRSVDPAEGVANSLIIVDALPSPEAMLADVPGEENLPAAAVFRYNPNHRWWYYSGMNRDEALILKFHDSDRSTAWRTPHTAFRDASFPDAKERASVEFRSVAYFD